MEDDFTKLVHDLNALENKLQVVWGEMAVPSEQSFESFFYSDYEYLEFEEVFLHSRFDAFPWYTSEGTPVWTVLSYMPLSPRTYYLAGYILHFIVKCREWIECKDGPLSSANREYPLIELSDVTLVSNLLDQEYVELVRRYNSQVHQFLHDLADFFIQYKSMMSLDDKELIGMRVLYGLGNG
ncbi:hypothetical protein [Persicirhabdus sediminis]|uniref:Uncharacterized protein n=1 Tax=Persicirhabdus sediminis TaxID=454144 RepID=A0A8J7MJ47_9BACT|nr:hypothetical protein [Persicirhabdus sediminis]MBK1791953.1 hypothetical protein [Persicirhabdus sediminis]